MEKYGVDYLDTSLVLTTAECDSIFQKQLFEARELAKKLFGEIPCDCANAAFVDMAYDRKSTLEVKDDLIAAIKKGDYRESAWIVGQEHWCY